MAASPLIGLGVIFRNSEINVIINLIQCHYKQRKTQLQCSDVHLIMILSLGPAPARVLDLLLSASLSLCLPPDLPLTVSLEDCNIIF